MSVQGAAELREGGLWLSSEPRAVGGRDEDLPQHMRDVGVSESPCCPGTAVTCLWDIPLPLSHDLPGPWPKGSITRECISEKWDEIVRIDGSELEVLIS